MKKYSLCLVLVLISPLIFSQLSNEKVIKLTDLEGLWYVNQTNFPMWLKGNRTAPRLNYTIQTKRKDTVLFDRVNYIQNEKEKNIKGYDWALNENHTKFVWRGKGLLRILKSKWEILYINLEEQWAITYFEKTLFTPEGYDVISKEETLSPDIQKQVVEKLKDLNVSSTLTSISQKRVE
ncbi:MAG: hypothetical protein AB8B56_06165 [Crocinitomicaceae bacterium]